METPDYVKENKSSKSDPVLPEAPKDATPDALDRNIKLIADLREKYRRNKSISTHVAEEIGDFFGSTLSVALHFVFFAGWILLNTNLFPNFPFFDPHPYYLLSTITCLEAIFLSMFVLIRQKRSMVGSEKRSELDLQLSLLLENEVVRLVRLNVLIAKKLGIDPEKEIEELHDMDKPINAVDVLSRLEQANVTEH